MKKTKKWWASSRATDGTQFYWTKRGDMNQPSYGRHITTTFSWDLENSTTNTESELCWTKGGGKIDTEHIIDRAITTTILVNRQHIKLMCTFTTQNMRTTTLRRCTKQSRNTWCTTMNTFQSLEEISMLSWDLEKERNVKVLADTLSTKATKEVIGWTVGWCYMIIPPSIRCSGRLRRNWRPSSLHKGKKQSDYILTKRRYLRNVKDAEANDMIHMGSDHRCVVATFMITMFGKNIHIKNKKKTRRLSMMNATKQKNISIEMPEIEKRYQEIVDTLKKPPPQKEMKHVTQGRTKKAQVKRENAAAAEAESTFAEAEAQEIERRSLKRSSTVANQRWVPAQHEHRRQDGWTSTPRGSDDEKKCSERDRTAGERLQNQRPHPLVRIEGEEGAHEIDTRNGCSGSCDVLAGERLPKQRPQGDEHPEHNSEEHHGSQVPHQDEEAGSIVFHSSSNTSEINNDNKEAHVTASAAAKVSEDLSIKDAEILTLIEERRSTPKEEKQRLKEVKCIRNV